MSTILSEIERVMADPDMFDGPEEPMPTEAAINKACVLLEDAGKQIHGGLPAFNLVPFYGELDFAWGKGSRFLRLRFFSESREPLLYWQSKLGQTGEYANAADSKLLVDRLAWLSDAQ